MFATLVNGRPGTAVHVADRGLQYGDGLFETMAVRGARALLWERHLQRLEEGCRRMGMTAPHPQTLAGEARRLCDGLQRAVLKIIVTRGGGGRGYRPPRDGAPTRILSTHPWPQWPGEPAADGVAVRVCRTRLARGHPLAGVKHLNRLEQVMARAEWDDPQIPEGLMLDYDGRVIAGTMSNVFMVTGSELITPDVSEAGVAGVVRGLLLETARELGLTPIVRTLSLGELGTADEVFLCNSLFGVWPVRTIDDSRRFAPGPVTRRLAEGLERLSGAAP